MMAYWMIYCLLTSAFLAGGAYAAERGFRLYRRPLRWIWSAAMLGSLGLPLSAYLLPRSQALPQPLGSAIEFAMGGAEVINARFELALGESALQVDEVLLALWLAISLGLAALYLHAYLRLRTERRTWTTQMIGRKKVHVSPQRGPAVIGFFRGAIVVPDWVFELEKSLQRIILWHEEEHLRAGDHRLLLPGLATLVVMPWNLPLWWQFRRLRLAIELDCDRRLLRGGAPARRYSELLVEIGGRASGLRLVPAAFAESKSALEVRLQAITARVARRRAPKAVGAATLAGVLLALACVAASGPEPPTAPPDEDQLDEAPVFTPFTSAPRIIDRLAAVESVKRHYPELLKKAGIGGTTTVWVFIDVDGRVKNTQIQQSSGREELDQAAQAAVLEFEFVPGRNRDRVVPVWVAIPIRFSPSSGENDAVLRLRGALRMIATVQEDHFREAGRYYRSVDEEALKSIVPNDVEIISFVASEDGWAVVVKQGEVECAMYYGRIEAPRPYAEMGRAVCR